MFHLRRMTPADVPFGVRLKEQAGWNQTEADWRRFLAIEPDGCFVAEWDGRPAGTVTTCTFDSIGWIAMVLVDEPMCHQGIGTHLVECALEYLDRRRVGTARLDATPLGRPIYRRLGFVAEYDLVRWQGAARGGTSHGAVRPFQPDDLDDVLQLDRQVTGTDRRRLLERLFSERPDSTRVFTEAGKITGCLTLRPGSRATQIGPAAALSPEAGAALADEALRQCGGRTVFIDIPVDNRPATQWARSHGLTRQRDLTRMHRGQPVDDHPDRLWASSGPEKG